MKNYKIDNNLKRQATLLKGKGQKEGELHANPKEIKLNSNKERRAYWEMLEQKHNSRLGMALNSLPMGARRVLELHYKQNFTFSEIATIVNLSVTAIRNYHNRGIYKLYRYFNPRQFNEPSKN